MSDEKSQSTPDPEPIPIPIQVIHSVDGYMAIYKRNLIAFGSGALPHEEPQISTPGLFDNA